MIKKYVRWFEFAQKTRNKDNEEKDFEEYHQDEIFLKMINRITKKSFNNDENQYIEEQAEFWENYGKLTTRLYNSGLNDGMEKGREEGKEIEKIQIAVALLDILDVETIAKKTGLSIKVVQNLKIKHR